MSAPTTYDCNDGLTALSPVRCTDWLGRVLVACEYSGSVRDAFAALGWDAWSCDLLPSEKPGNHHQCDVRDILDEGWDIMVAHPPCTHLAVSGARWFKNKVREQAEALDFVRLLLAAPIPHIAIENPISIISSRIRKPDQIIQPWQFGHGETKATCLWLKNLPRLTPSNVVEGREQRIWKLPPSADRWKEQSRTFSGVAQAMATQWTLATRPNNGVTCYANILRTNIQRRMETVRRRRVGNSGDAGKWRHGLPDPAGWLSL